MSIQLELNYNLTFEKTKKLPSAAFLVQHTQLSPQSNSIQSSATMAASTTVSLANYLISDMDDYINIK